MTMMCVDLLSAGPGFTGMYAWSSGLLVLQPDPFVALGMASPAPTSGHRLLRQSGTADASPTAVAEQSNVWATKQCSRTGGDHQGHKQGSSCPAAELGRALLQAPATPFSSSSGASVHGLVEAKEMGASSPTRAKDGLRGDGRVWVDEAGAIRVVGEVSS
jgi:hypothetical protein